MARPDDDDDDDSYVKSKQSRSEFELGFISHNDNH